MLLNLRLFGQFEGFRNGQPLPQGVWGRRKALALAKLFIANRGVAFSHDQLTELLYEGASPDLAVSYLYRRISEVRRALEPDLKQGRCSSFIKQQGQAYVFCREAPCQIDVEVFLDMVEKAQDLKEARRDAAAVECFRNAVAIYRGDFLEEDRYEEWTQVPRERYREIYLAALCQLADCYAELGEYDRASRACECVLDIQPYREPAIRQLMEYYAILGNRPLAIATYNNGIRALADVLDVQPEAETTQLFKRIVSPAGIRTRKRVDKGRIAVLPFVNVGGRPANRFFVDGLTEEVIHVLSNVQRFRVISQTSVSKYAEERKSVAEIARELNVGTVLEGSVRMLGNHVRIAVKLSDIETEEHLWSETYDRELGEVLSVQSQIAGSVARALCLHLGEESPYPLQGTQTGSWDAYERYVIGRYHWNQRTPKGYERAAQLFQEALTLDPKYSKARAALAATWCDLGASSRIRSDRQLYGEKAEAEARRVLELDPHSAEARATLGRNRMYFKHDPMGAVRELEEAIRLNPSYAMACNWLGVFLIGLARFDEAVEVLHRAHRLDPLSLAVIRNLARAYYNARRYDEAIEQLQKALDLDPDFSGIHFLLGLINIELARYDQAILEFEKESLLNRQFASSENALIGVARSRNGDPSLLNDLVRTLQAEGSETISSSDPVWTSVALLEAGYETPAISCLNLAMETSVSWFVLYIHSPLFDAVGDKAWYVSLLRRAGLVSS